MYFVSLGGVFGLASRLFGAVSQPAKLGVVARPIVALAPSKTSQLVGRRVALALRVDGVEKNGPCSRGAADTRKHAWLTTALHMAIILASSSDKLSHET